MIFDLPKINDVLFFGMGKRDENRKNKLELITSAAGITDAEIDKVLNFRLALAIIKIKSSTPQNYHDVLIGEENRKHAIYKKALFAYINFAKQVYHLCNGADWVSDKMLLMDLADDNNKVAKLRRYLYTNRKYYEQFCELRDNMYKSGFDS